MKHSLMACICTTLLSYGPPLHTTSLFLYTIINKTGLPLQATSHNLSLEQDTTIILENPGALKKLVLQIEEEAVEPIKVRFTPPLDDNCHLELHKAKDDEDAIDVLVGPNQTWNKHFDDLQYALLEALDAD